MPSGDKLSFHGSALAKIVEHVEFTALNRADRRRYQLNDNVQFSVKYTKKSGQRYTFGFSAREVRELASATRPGDEQFLVLVCGRRGICALDRDDLLKVLALERTSGAQWIEVMAPANKSFRVRGPAGRLDRMIPRNAFPRRLFKATRDRR
jgi:hypothetical protein